MHIFNFCYGGPYLDKPFKECWSVAKSDAPADL